MFRLAFLSPRLMSSGWRFIDGSFASGCFTSAAKVIHVYMWCRFCSEMISYLWCEFMSICLPKFSWSMIVYWFLRFVKSNHRTSNHRTSIRLLYTHKCTHNQACAWQCAICGYMIFMVCYMLYSSALSIAAMILGNDPLWQLIAWLLKGMNWQFLCTDFCILTFFDMKILC